MISINRFNTKAYAQNQNSQRVNFGMNISEFNKTIDAIAEGANNKVARPANANLYVFFHKVVQAIHESVTAKDKELSELRKSYRCSDIVDLFVKLKNEFAYYISETAGKNSQKYIDPLTQTVHAIPNSDEAWKKGESFIERAIISRFVQSKLARLGEGEERDFYQSLAEEFPAQAHAIVSDAVGAYK